MSDTTAFLSGCAITGVAAVLLLGGGLAVGQYRTSSPPGTLPSVPIQTLPATPETAAPIPVPPPYSTGLPASGDTSELSRDLEQQRSEATALKSQVEDLKGQIEQQRNEMQRLTAQIQAQQETINAIAARPDRSEPLGSGQSQTLLMGAIGFGFLVILGGGGAVLIGVIVLLIQSQRRSNRTMHVIHPVQPTYSFSDQELLPPAMRPRRARQINYYED